MRRDTTARAPAAFHPVEVGLHAFAVVALHARSNLQVDIGATVEVGGSIGRSHARSRNAQSWRANRVAGDVHLDVAQWRAIVLNAA